MTTDQKEKRNDEYNKYVKRVTPTHCLSANMLKAFILGGIICTIGQLIVNTCTQYFGLSSDEASAWCSMILILISQLSLEKMALRRCLRIKKGMLAVFHCLTELIS